MNQGIENILQKMGSSSEFGNYKLVTLSYAYINNPYGDSEKINSPIKYIYDKKSIENLRRKGEFNEINDILEKKYSEIYTIYLKGEGLDNNNCNIEEMTPKKKIFSIEKKNNNQKIPPKSSQSIISNNSEDKKTSKFLARKTKYGRRKNYPDDMKNKLKVIFQNILLKL